MDPMESPVKHLPGLADNKAATCVYLLLNLLFLSPFSLTFFSHLHPTFILLLFQRPFSKFPLQLCQLNLHYIYLSVLLSWLMTFAHEKLRALPPSLIETGSFISLFNLLNLILYYPSNVPILNQLNPYS